VREGTEPDKERTLPSNANPDDATHALKGVKAYVPRNRCYLAHEEGRIENTLAVLTGEARQILIIQ